MTTTTFPKASRGPGHITTPAVQITTNNITKSVSVAALMDTADLSDATLSLTLGIEISPDDVTFTPCCTVNWQGGRTDKVTGTWAVPQLNNFKIDNGQQSLLMGQYIRAFADLPKTLNFGATVTVNN